MFLSFSPDPDILNGTVAYFNNKDGIFLDYISAEASNNNEFSSRAINFSTTISYSSGERDEPQWYQVEFKRSYLFISSYTLRSTNNPIDYNGHLRSWNFLGSLDKIHWDKLDNHTLYDGLNGYGSTHNFKCSQGLYRFFRIQQTSPEFAGLYGFGFRRVEFFGSLFEGEHIPQYRISSCYFPLFFKNYVLFLFLFIFHFSM